jgi:hypothetical protein
VWSQRPAKEAQPPALSPSTSNSTADTTTAKHIDRADAPLSLKGVGSRHPPVPGDSRNSEALEALPAHGTTHAIFRAPIPATPCPFPGDGTGASWVASTRYAGTVKLEILEIL